MVYLSKAAEWSKKQDHLFTPTSASWLNMVERFFAEITSKRIWRGRFTSADDLETAIYGYLLQHNAKPKPFTWTKNCRGHPRQRTTRPERPLMKSAETGSKCQIQNTSSNLSDTTLSRHISSKGFNSRHFRMSYARKLVMA